MAEQDFRIRAYEREAAKVVSHFRALADDLERHVKPYKGDIKGVDSPGRFIDAAEAVNHAITWGVANAGAYRLMHSAAHADDAERTQDPS